MLGSAFTFVHLFELHRYARITRRSVRIELVCGLAPVSNNLCADGLVAAGDTEETPVYRHRIASLKRLWPRAHDRAVLDTLGFLGTSIIQTRLDRSVAGEITLLLSGAAV